VLAPLHGRRIEKKPRHGSGGTEGFLMMKRLFLSAVIGCVLIRSGMAAPPSDQSISEMMNAMQLQALLNQALHEMDQGMSQSMEQGLQKSLQGKTLTPAQKEAVEAFRGKFTAAANSELSFAKVKDLYVQSYRETFTQDEVDAIIAFYKSPAGKAVTEKYPMAMKKANGLMQARIGPLTMKLQTMLNDFVTDLEKQK
jgi:hypothetical protein